MAPLSFDTHNEIRETMYERGYIVLDADAITLPSDLTPHWEALRTEYDMLPADEYLPDGGSYRFRRYDSFTFLPETGELMVLPHQDYYQSRDINSVTGGIVRRFAPLTPATIANPYLHALIRWDFAQFPLDDPAWARARWQVDVHQIQVVAGADEQGQPTPEGVHRDGAHFVTVHLARLENASGGEVSIYDDDRRLLTTFTLDHIGATYLFNDRILWHGVTPIQPIDPAQPAQRGILTFDYHLK